MGTRFALVGDIHGRFQVLAEALNAARRRWGQFDLVLAAGDVAPNRVVRATSGRVGTGSVVARSVGASP